MSGFEPSTNDEYLKRRKTQFLDSLSWAAERNYTGWDYGDGMSSKLLQVIPVDNKWVNLAFQEIIKRAPVNVRPVFFVEQRRNFMGAALFAMANFNAWELTGDFEYAQEGRMLVEWLTQVQPETHSGFCGCHRHDLQGLERKVSAGTPGIVGTTFGVLALLQAATVFDDSYAETAQTAAQFIFDDLGYTEYNAESEETETGPEAAHAHINYKPGEGTEYQTLNANALGARTLLELYDWFGTDRFREAATKILNYVASEQTAVGGWHYRDPPESSHLSMDNHHNGFIIESFLCYDAIVGDGRFREQIDSAVEFYRECLFEPDGAPNFDESSLYPRDIHASAQGILVFTYAGELDFARRVVDWAFSELYDESGRFYFRKERFYTKRYTLMRWCQAWMTYALSEYLLALHDSGSISRSKRVLRDELYL